MCNRYRASAARQALAERYGVTLEDQEYDRIPLPELFPKRVGWIVRQNDGGRVLDTATWGFPPPVAARAPITNVRNYASPFWRSALVNPDRRCLVPFDEFCEWSGEKGSKVEHWFAVPSLPIASFAGVWRPVEGGKAYAFLTCGYDGDPASHIVGAVHPKACPVVLDREDEDRWLNAPIEEALELACPMASQLMTVR